MTIPRETAFDEKEFEARLANTRREMAASGIDTLIIHSAPNIYYLCGHFTLNLWDYQCLIIPLDDPMVVVLWQFERGRFEATASLAELELYETGADFVQTTRDVLLQRGLLTGTIGIEAQSRYLVPQLHSQITAALSEVNVVNGSGLIDSVRNIKSEAELNVIRRAAQITDKAILQGFDSIQVGVTDSEVASCVAASLINNHSFGFSVYPIISAGYRAGMPHNSNFGYVIKEADTVFIECSPSHWWYHAPLMRTAAVGKVDRKIEDFAKIEQQAVAAMLDRARNGVPAAEVAEVAKAHIAPIRDQILFHEVYGYPVGIGFPPTWAEESGFAILPSNHRPLASGMVFHIPMTLRVNGQFGVGLSETFIVREEGPAESLSQIPLSLHRV